MSQTGKLEPRSQGWAAARRDFKAMPCPGARAFTCPWASRSRGLTINTRWDVSARPLPTPGRPPHLSTLLPFPWGAHSPLSHPLSSRGGGRACAGPGHFHSRRAGCPHPSARAPASPTHWTAASDSGKKAPSDSWDSEYALQNTPAAASSYSLLSASQAAPRRRDVKVWGFTHLRGFHSPGLQPQGRSGRQTPRFLVQPPPLQALAATLMCRFPSWRPAGRTLVPLPP